MNQQPAVGPMWHPKKNPAPETLTSPPSRWRSACASLSLAALTLLAVSASAQINWIDTDLGPTPQEPGATVVNGDGSLTITGGGSDIWNNTSQCHYRYAWAVGTNWDAVIQVQNMVSTGDPTWTKCELMVDWPVNLAIGPQGSDAFIAAMNTLPTGDNEYGVDQYRTTSGGSADWKQLGTSPHPVYPNVWMKIHRSFSVFTLYYSTDGVTWNLYGSIDTSSSSMIGQDNNTVFGVPWPDVLCVGIAVTAHDDVAGDIATATVANVSVTFPPILAPTVVNATVQPTNVTSYVGGEVSFSFATTNNSTAGLAQTSYLWYKNGVAQTNATGTSFTWLADASDNNAQIYCVATIAPPYNTSVSSVKSQTATLTVANTGVVKTGGLKVEFFSGAASRQAVEGGNVGPASSLFVWNNWDNPGGYGNNYVDRVSGYFIPPTTDKYVFYAASDDDSDLFLSTTGAAAENKQLIAQATSWNNIDNWEVNDINSAPGANSPAFNYSQSESDTFQDPVTGNIPFANGISLTAGQKYYIEGVHYQGGGGDQYSVTYQTATMMGGGNPANATLGQGGTADGVAIWQSTFTNGVHSLLYGTNNNIAFVSTPDTTPTWTLQPSNTTVTAGLNGAFFAAAVDGGEFAPNYQWYSNNVPVGGNNTSFGWGTTPASAGGQQYYCVATGVMNGLSATSAVVTVNIATPVLEHGWAKVEYWYNKGLAALEAGTLGAPDYIITTPRFEQATVGNTAGTDYATRMTTLFFPPTSTTYDFYVNSDDQSDLFVDPTGSTGTGKVMVASEAQWSNPWQWEQDEGNNLVVPQKQSPTFSPDGGATTPFANGIYLQAGTGYYIELDHQDTGGGNNSEATFEVHGQPAPNNGDLSQLAGNVIAMNVPKSFATAFTATGQPANTSAPFFGYANFSVSATTDSKIAVGTTGDPRPLWNNYIVYQWYRNGTPIVGANANTYSFGPVTAPDVGDLFTCEIRSLGLVDGSGNDTWITSSPAKLTAVTGSSEVVETGVVLHQYWGNNPTTGQIEAGTAGAPSWSMSCPAFDSDVPAGTEVADNFSDAEFGFFIPPSTGNYVFFVGADDTADLLLSLDSSFADAFMIAQQTSAAGTLAWGAGGGGVSISSSTFVNANGITPYPNGIPLVAGKKYAMEVVHHQATGGTWFGATAEFQTDPNYPSAPAAGTLSTMRGSQVAAYVPPCTYVNITQQPQPVTVPNYTRGVTFNIAGATDSTTPVGPEGDWRGYFNNFLMYQWYKNGQAVAGATSSTYTIPEVLPTDNNSTVYCTVRALGYEDGSGNPLWVTSTVVPLTVIVAPPQLVGASYYVNTNNVGFGGTASSQIVVTFSAPMDPNGLGNASTYILPGSLGLLGIAVNSNNFMSAVLTVSGNVTLPLTININSLNGQNGLAVANKSAAVTLPELMDTDIGVPGTDPAVPGTMYVDGPNAYTISAEGSDIWGAADGFNFAYEQKTGNFDVVVRVQNAMHTSEWSKGGLMVRQDLSAGSRNWNMVCGPLAADGIEAPDNSGYGDNDVEANTRNAVNYASNTGWDFNPRPTPDYPNAWVRLTRTTTTPSNPGNLLSAYYSTDGKNWTLQATNDPSLVGDKTPLPQTVYVGLATSAHNNDALPITPPLLYLNTVSYDNYNSSYVQNVTSTVKATMSATQITITWVPSTGTLQSGPTPTGPWSNVTGASGGSYSIPLPTANQNQFYRVSN